MIIDHLNPRTIVSALNPRRFEADWTEIFMDVWFEELSGSVPFIASPFYDYRYGRELWFMAMAGHFGPIEVITSPPPGLTAWFPSLLPSPPKLLTYDKEPPR